MSQLKEFFVNAQVVEKGSRASVLVLLHKNLLPLLISCFYYLLHNYLYFKLNHKRFFLSCKFFIISIFGQILPNKKIIYNLNKFIIFKELMHVPDVEYYLLFLNNHFYHYYAYRHHGQ